MSFEIKDFLELTDKESLSKNGLEPLIKIVDHVITINIGTSLASIHSLGPTGKEILFVLRLAWPSGKESEPLILLMEEFEGLPPAPLKTWAEIDNGVFYENPDEKDLSKLFGVKYLTPPSGREYARTIPPILKSEKAGDPHLSGNIGKAKGKTLSGSVLGEITLYEVQDENPLEAFILFLNLLNQENTENGGLVHMYLGREIKYSDIQQ